MKRLLGEDFSSSMVNVHVGFIELAEKPGKSLEKGQSMIYSSKKLELPNIY